MAAEPTLWQVAPRTPADRARLVRRAKVLAWGGNASAPGRVCDRRRCGDRRVVGCARRLRHRLADRGRRRRRRRVALHGWAGASAPPSARAQRLIAREFFALAVSIAVDSIRSFGAITPRRATSASGSRSSPLRRCRCSRAPSAASAGSSARRHRERGRPEPALRVPLRRPARRPRRQRPFGWWWADPLAGLVIAAVAVREGASPGAATAVRTAAARSRGPVSWGDARVAGRA